MSSNGKVTELGTQSKVLRTVEVIEMQLTDSVSFCDHFSVLGMAVIVRRFTDQIT